MTVTRDELDRFHRFVAEGLNHGGANLSLEEFVRQWRIEQERAETIAAVQRGVEDIEAGRSFTLDEVKERLRQELGTSPPSP